METPRNALGKKRQIDHGDGIPPHWRKQLRNNLQSSWGSKANTYLCGFVWTVECNYNNFEPSLTTTYYTITSKFPNGLAFFAKKTAPKLSRHCLTLFIKFCIITKLCTTYVGRSSWFALRYVRHTMFERLWLPQHGNLLAKCRTHRRYALPIVDVRHKSGQARFEAPL